MKSCQEIKKPRIHQYNSNTSNKVYEENGESKRKNERKKKNNTTQKWINRKTKQYRLTIKQNSNKFRIPSSTVI